jgi:urease accessory protein
MTRNAITSIIISAAVLGLSATAASAHVGHGAEGFAQGFFHPIGGLDHVLAMLASGLLGAMIGGKARWFVPLTFIVAMVVGGVLGASGYELPLVETMILASVVVLAGLAAFGRYLSLRAMLPLIGGFALFHGFAHGAEMPANISALQYAAGFVAATSFLHVAAIIAVLGYTKAWPTKRRLT